MWCCVFSSSVICELLWEIFLPHSVALMRRFAARVAAVFAEAALQPCNVTTVIALAVACGGSGKLKNGESRRREKGER